MQTQRLNNSPKLHAWEYERRLYFIGANDLIRATNELTQTYGPMVATNGQYLGHFFDLYAAESAFRAALA